MNPEELRIESWPLATTSGLHVGMSVGVRITHKPTGIAVVCDSERSQHKNRDRAILMLSEELSRLTRANPASGEDIA